MGPGMEDRDRTVLRRSSLAPPARRVSTALSRRHSHCSIIETGDRAVVLVESSDSSCLQPAISCSDVTDRLPVVAGTGWAGSLHSCRDSSSSADSSDLDTELRRMEETQQEIAVTLGSLLGNAVGHSDHHSTLGSHRPCHARHQSPYAEEAVGRQIESQITAKSGNLTTNLNSDDRKNFEIHRNSYDLASPVKTKFHELIKSVKNIRPRRSVEERGPPQAAAERLERKILQPESFSVEDFTALMRELPANHFLPEVGVEAVGEERGRGGPGGSDSTLLHIVRELVDTERDYCANLALLTQQLPAYLAGCEEAGLPDLLDCVPELSSLPAILHTSQALLGQFEARLAGWEERPRLAGCFTRPGPRLLLPYLPYLTQFSALCHNLAAARARHPALERRCAQFEQLPACRALQIPHFLLKPVQRLPQYKLLLQQYSKHLQPGSGDEADTALAIQILSDTLNLANSDIP